MTRADRARLDRLLEPIRAPEARRHGPRAGVEAAREAPDAARQLLGRHEVGGVWRYAVRAAGLWPQVPASLRSALDETARLQLAISLVQMRGLNLARRALEAAGVPHVVFKGAHLTRTLYDAPAMRPMADIDLLVPLDRRLEALEALAAAGFGGAPLAATISHEIPLRGHGLELDLHWALLRPGRLRSPWAPAVLATRRLAQGVPVPDDAHALALMLVHPAVTEYVTYRLMRAVDVDRWVRSRAVPWEQVVRIVRDAGLGTAAWVMCTWTRRWLSTPIPPVTLRALAPGPGRRAYLDAWLRLDPAARHRGHPLLVRGAFGLALHDTPADAVRALRRLNEARLTAPEDCAAVARALQGTPTPAAGD